jgi:CHAT domain-containing protein
MNQNFYGKKLHSLFLWVFLFILAMFIPPVVASVASPPAIVQTHRPLNPPNSGDLQSSSPQTWGAGGANRISSQTNPSQLVQQAQALYNQQQYESALPLWDEAAKGFAKIGDSLNSAIALSNLSLTYQQLGQWDAANTAIESSLKLLESESAEDSLVLAQTLDIQGKLQRETVKAAKALETWQLAANIYQELNNSTALTQNNLNQAQALQDLGLYPRACKRILSTLAFENISTCNQLNQLTTEQLAAKLKPITSKASLTTVSALRNLGNLLLIIGQPQQSEQILTASLSSAQKLDSPQELSLTYLRLGNTYQALATGEEVRSTRRQYEQQALDVYNQVIKLSPSPTTKLKAQLNQLYFLIQQEEWSEAESLWKTIYPQVADSNLSLDREHIYAKINYAQNIIKVLAQKDQAIPDSLQLPSKAEIEQILVNATQQAQTLGDQRIEAYAWGTLGRLSEITGAYSTAETQTKKALNLVSNYNAADIAYQYFWQLGRIQKKQERIPEAIAAYTKAYDALQSLRSDLATINPEVQFSFRDQVEPVYRELVELDVKEARIREKAGNKAASQARLIQARDVVESLQVAQLNNFFREACIDANPQAIDAIDPQAAVVYPIILQDQLEILFSLPKQAPRLYQSNVSQTELENTVEAINNSLLSSAIPVKSLLPQYQQVYRWLIKPLEAELTKNQVKTLAFVLDGALRNIPMSVLHDGKQYLVEKYALALTPGLQLLDPKPLTAIQLDAITGGISKVRPDFAPHQNFGDLPKVAEELQTISKIGLTKSSLLNDQFTKQALKQNITASGSPIVHLATHAKFSSKAEDTFILSWDGQINIKELDNLLRDDTFNRKNDIELLVLSACETASGDPRATLGLAGVAVQAGARSTLATLWSVVDESTAQIMGEFYRQLQKSGTTKANKAEILRQAQLTLIKDQKFNHPHFWSPFILVGNWQ